MMRPIKANIQPLVMSPYIVSVPSSHHSDYSPPVMYAESHHSHHCHDHDPYYPYDYGSSYYDHHYDHDPYYPYDYGSSHYDHHCDYHHGYGQYHDPIVVSLIFLHSVFPNTDLLFQVSPGGYGYNYYYPRSSFGHHLGDFFCLPSHHHRHHHRHHYGFWKYMILVREYFLSGDYTIFTLVEQSKILKFVRE